MRERQRTEEAPESWSNPSAFFILSREHSACVRAGCFGLIWFAVFVIAPVATFLAVGYHGGGHRDALGRGAVVFLHDKHDCRFRVFAACSRGNNTCLSLSVKINCFRLRTVTVPAAPRHDSLPLHLRRLS